MKTKFTYKLIFKIIAYIITIFTCVSCIAVFFYKFIPPLVTPLMVIRAIEGAGNIGIDKNWVSYDEVSPHIFRACIAAEDARFLSHNGIDWKAVKVAQRYNEIHKGKKTHGASTITMQTAKNVFLWNGRNFIRKGLEAYFTTLIEEIWGKKRILEIYVNIIELGDGIYGVEAAAQKYFNKSASQLTKHQAALLVSIIPNPRKYSCTNPTPYIRKRTNWIERRMNSIALPK
jgi:monofunctional biosynthetic peptidoglycan transglycosylase